MKIIKKLSLTFIILLFLGCATSVFAASIGEKKVFYVDSGYDLSGRNKINTVLISESSKLYVYADESWWNGVFQNEYSERINSLETEFENVIYPRVTAFYGTEWNPGIDKDSKITILLEPMKNGFGGYFRSNDEYPKIQISDSNEREMVYLNSENVKSEIFKSLLAHEFTHLVTFNQKENIRNVIEDVWLNEARAEYASTIAGYDSVYSGSVLEKRVQIFKDNPFDSLVEWGGKPEDYGSITLFINYLVDQYGAQVLKDTMTTAEVGINSINYALAKNGHIDNFDSVFKNWMIAVLMNNCAYGQKYCYINPNLINFHITGQINFLPILGESSLTFSDIAKKWSGNWYKIIGGNGALDFKFTGLSDTDFYVPYITQSKSGGYTVNFLKLDKDGKGEVVISDFGTEIVSLYVISSLLDAKYSKPFYAFSWTVSTKRSAEDPEIINSLLARIEDLKRQIATLQAQINSSKGNATCIFNNNIYYGLKNSDVICLQKFLLSQGSAIYPEGLVTGYFGSSTKSAVVRFQQKYGISPTGYVGLLTRNKIKQLQN
jgi:peptidoglycan hydrolase-like protein with peptidoglycan-binding domain